MDVISRAANLTQKADESLGDAERLIDGRSFDIAALRCYHAVRRRLAPGGQAG